MKTVKLFFSRIPIGAVFSFDGYPDASFRKVRDNAYSPLNGDESWTEGLLTRDYICCMNVSED